MYCCSCSVIVYKPSTIGTCIWWNMLCFHVCCQTPNSNLQALESTKNTHTCVSSNKVKHPTNKQKQHMGGCKKTPSPFKWFFQNIVFFPLIVFPSAGFTPWAKNSHERGKGKEKGIVKEGKGKNRKGRGKGKGKEKERERKKKAKGRGKEKRKEKERKRKGKRKGKRTGKRKGEGKRSVKEETGKRKGTGEERERKRTKKAVSHTDHFWCQKLSFVCVCVPFFFWQSSKKECSDHLPDTFLVQNLRHYHNKQWKEKTKSTK